MSASSCIGYIGLRFEVRADEIDQLEGKSDPRQIAARRVGLSSYWANFGGETERYVLLVGTRIATLGPENDLAATLLTGQLLSLASDTSDRLRSANLVGEVSLHLEWLEDA